MLILGDCIEKMRELEDASIDAVVTDPPYGISFMGKHWDRFDIEQRVGKRDVSKLGTRLSGDLDRPDARKPIARTASAFANAAGEAGDYDLTPKGNRRFQVWTEAWAREAFRVLKPGGHLLCFASTRTYHRMACGVEEAGFEIRDTVAWMFGSGFPKSLNLDGDREGWGTALKPAFEPVVVARKPLTGTVAATVLEHGTGALNIDGCRVEGIADRPGSTPASSGERTAMNDLPRVGYDPSEAGRWPANVVLDNEAAAMLDAQTGELAAGNHPALRSARGDEKVYGSGWSSGTEGERRSTETGGASRFFYCAKVSRAERNAGLDTFEERLAGCMSGHETRADRPANHTMRANVHPTVKPLDLMRWLCRLVTPPGGTVLDPFLGSGSTGCAAALEGFDFVGIEREPDYMAIAEARIAFWAEHGDAGLDIVRARDAADRVRQEIADAGQLDLLAEGAA